MLVAARDKAVVELKREKLAAENSGRYRIQQNNHTVPVGKSGGLEA